MQIGLLSDLHCELEPAHSRWINEFASDALDTMIDDALAWFGEAAVDLVVILGDVVQFPHVEDLEHAFARVAAASPAPVVAVNGNHDLRLGDAFAARARAHGIALLTEQPVELAGVSLRGIELGPGPRAPQYVGRPGARAGEGLDVVASHFPILSEALGVAGAGLPYAGDLVNRAELEALLRSEERPTLVVSGHIHARSTAQAATLLQFSVGAVIEPPFDATIVDIDATAARVRRRARRLGAIAPIDPVFAPDAETWQWDGRWRAVANGR